MKLKLTHQQLKYLVLIIQEAPAHVLWDSAFEREISKMITTELEEQLLQKVIKRKDENKITLKTYQVAVVQLYALWDRSDDRYRNNLCNILVQQTDKEMIKTIG
jgi:hypothetical protein